MTSHRPSHSDMAYEAQTPTPDRRTALGRMRRRVERLLLRQKGDRDDPQIPPPQQQQHQQYFPSDASHSFSLPASPPLPASSTSPQPLRTRYEPAGASSQGHLPLRHPVTPETHQSSLPARPAGTTPYANPPCQLYNFSTTSVASAGVFSQTSTKRSSWSSRTGSRSQLTTPVSAFHGSPGHACRSPSRNPHASLDNMLSSAVVCEEVWDGAAAVAGPARSRCDYEANQRSFHSVAPADLDASEDCGWPLVSTAPGPEGIAPAGTPAFGPVTPLSMSSSFSRSSPDLIASAARQNGPPPPERSPPPPPAVFGIKREQANASTSKLRNEVTHVSEDDGCAVDRSGIAVVQTTSDRAASSSAAYGPDDAIERCPGADKLSTAFFDRLSHSVVDEDVEEIPRDEHPCPVYKEAWAGKAEGFSIFVRQHSRAHNGDKRYLVFISAAAAWRGKTAIIEVMIELGVDLNMPLDGPCGTVLLAAVSSNDPSVGDNEVTIRYLLDNGADVNLSPPGSSSALEAAAAKGEKNIVQLLLDRGANIVQHKERAFIQAKKGANKEILMLLHIPAIAPWPSPKSRMEGVESACQKTDEVLQPGAQPDKASSCPPSPLPPPLHPDEPLRSLTLVTCNAGSGNAANGSKCKSDQLIQGANKHVIKDPDTHGEANDVDGDGSSNHYRQGASSGYPSYPSYPTAGSGTEGSFGGGFDGHGGRQPFEDDGQGGGSVWPFPPSGSCDRPLRCPYYITFPFIYCASRGRKYRPCELTEFSTIASLTQHLHRDSAHRLTIDFQILSTHPLDIHDNTAVGVCRDCWESFMGTTHLRAHQSTTCTKSKLSRDEKWYKLQEVFCCPMVPLNNEDMAPISSNFELDESEDQEEQQYEPVSGDVPVFGTAAMPDGQVDYQQVPSFEVSHEPITGSSDGYPSVLPPTEPSSSYDHPNFAADPLAGQSDSFGMNNPLQPQAQYYPPHVNQYVDRINRLTTEKLELQERVERLEQQLRDLRVGQQNHSLQNTYDNHDTNYLIRRDVPYIQTQWHDSAPPAGPSTQPPVSAFAPHSAPHAYSQNITGYQQAPLAGSEFFAMFGGAHHDAGLSPQTPLEPFMERSRSGRSSRSSRSLQHVSTDYLQQPGLGGSPQSADSAYGTHSDPDRERRRYNYSSQS